MKLEKRCRNHKDVRIFLDEIDAEYRNEFPYYQRERRKFIEVLDNYIAIENMEWTRGRVDVIDIEAFLPPADKKFLEKKVKREIPKFYKFVKVRYIGVEWPYINILFDSHDYSNVAINIHFSNLDMEDFETDYRLMGKEPPAILYRLMGKEPPARRN